LRKKGLGWVGVGFWGNLEKFYSMRVWNTVFKYVGLLVTLRGVMPPVGPRELASRRNFGNFPAENVAHISSF